MVLVCSVWFCCHPIKLQPSTLQISKEGAPNRNWHRWCRMMMVREPRLTSSSNIQPCCKWRHGGAKIKMKSKRRTLDLLQAQLDIGIDHSGSSSSFLLLVEFRNSPEVITRKENNASKIDFPQKQLFDLLHHCQERILLLNQRKSKVSRHNNN